MNNFLPLSDKVEKAATQVVDAALKVHRELGPGLLESVYEVCLARELVKRGLNVVTQVPVAVVYDGETLPVGLRLDLLVENELVVELKAVEEMIPLYKAQVLTYLKLTNTRLGLLINFNVVQIKHGIQRVIL